MDSDNVKKMKSGDMFLALYADTYYHVCDINLNVYNIIIPYVSLIQYISTFVTQ